MATQVELIKLDTAQVANLLMPYRSDYLLVKAFEYDKGGETGKATVKLGSYPFTVDSMRYASVNLLNLAAEQSLLVHLDCEYQLGISPMLAPTYSTYREWVLAGHWLTPKINTRVRRLVDPKETFVICLSVKNRQVRKSKLYIKFSATVAGMLDISGTIVLVSHLPKAVSSI